MIPTKASSGLWWTRLSRAGKLAVAALTVGATGVMEYAVSQEPNPQCYSAPMPVVALIPAAIAGVSVLLGAWVAVRVGSGGARPGRLLVAGGLGLAVCLVAFAALSVVRFLWVNPFVVPGCFL